MTIVATTSIWADVAAAVAGDDATVEVLVPRGADPHGYQPSSRDVARLQSADLVIANGLGLEEGLSDVLDAAAAEGAVVIASAFVQVGSQFVVRTTLYHCSSRTSISSDFPVIDPTNPQ